MIRLGACLASVALLVVSSEARSGEPPDTQPAPSFRLARERFLNGEYEQAIRLYELLGKVPKDAVRAACGRSDVDLQVGDYTAGIARLSALERPGRSSAEWHVCLAALSVEVGRYESALDHNRRALAIDEWHLRARLQLGELCELLGRRPEAIKVYRHFEDVMLGGPLPDGAEELTTLGRGFLRYSVLTRDANSVRRTRHVLQEVYQEAFHFVDPLYWPARLAAAELLLDKHDLKEAESDFKAICEQNARVPAAHVGLGRIALARWEFEDTEQHAEAALEINSNCVAARILLADLRMTERRYAEAADIARQAIETNPNSPAALSVLAAAQLRAGDKAASRMTQQRALQINPRPAALHYALGVWQSAGRQYAEGVRHFKQAITCDPTWPAPRTELGLLHMETGDEAAAREMLESSFAIDGFNSRTYHVLQLLDSLENFARLSTEHFVIKYDAKEDAVVAPYFAEALEEMYPELCDHLGVSLEKPVIVELFPDHMAFSRRIASRPFVATVGACTGRVIAMEAPRTAGPFGRFNWRTVLRHELVHAVSLTATEGRIAHWMTEGLAVLEEPAPRSWSTQRLLSNTVRRQELFSLEAIDWGFIRPRRPNDRGLAYAQSEWMIEYMIDRFGHAAVLDLMAAFGAGKAQTEAFRHALKLDPKQFDADFKAWAAGQVEAWDLPVWPVDKPDEIKPLLEENPDDTALLVRLAWAELLQRELDAAEDAARKALERDENHAPALEVLSRILIARMLGEVEEEDRLEFIDQAEPHLRKLHALDPSNLEVAKHLAYVEQAREKWPEAIRLLAGYQRRFPRDPDPYRRLAAIHLRRKAPDQALPQLEELFRLVDDEPAVACQIAALHSDRKRHNQAAIWYRRAIEIDPYDADTHCALADACLEIGDFANAEREYRALRTLLPEDPRAQDGLSRVQKAKRNPAEPRAYQKEIQAPPVDPKG